MTTSLFGLSGEDYWNAPWKNSAQLHQQYVLEDQWGLYFDAPASVSSATKKSIPAALLYVASSRDALKADFERTAKIVAVRLEDRALFIGNAVPPQDTLPSPKVETDSEMPTSAKYTLDLHAQLRLLDMPGTYRVFVLLRGQMSNVIELRIDEGLDTFSLPGSLPPLPSPNLMASVEGLPEIPAEPGIALSIDRVVLDLKDSVMPLKGSFRIPAMLRERVPEPFPAGLDGIYPFPDYGTPRAAAVVPITLVVLSSQYAAAIVIRLQVPTIDATTGRFAIDLLRDPSIRGFAQTYFIYAFCGEFHAGPAIAATVTADMLPR
jgi:hypothetical protein